MSEPEQLLEEVLGKMPEDGVERVVVQVAVLGAVVVVEVDEVLDVVVGADVLDVLLTPQDGHTHHLLLALGHERLDLCAILGAGNENKF